MVGRDPRKHVKLRSRLAQKSRDLRPWRTVTNVHLPGVCPLLVLGGRVLAATHSGIWLP